MITPGTQFGAPLPGGVGVSHVRVYNSPGPDGLRGGTPHLHTVCTEAYLVIAGTGVVQTLSSAGYEETPLSAGTVAWFTPGTVHRLVNLDGKLELFVLMSNAGLPEAGDLVIAFAPEMLDRIESYRAAAMLPPDATTTDGPDGPVRTRRDLAVQGFAHWKAEIERTGPAALTQLHAAAARIVAEPAARWADLIDADPAQDLARSHAQVNALTRGDLDEVADQLGNAAIHRHDLLPDTRRYGCCGTLGTMVLPH